MEESVVLVSLCCFFAHICSRPSLLLSTDRVPRQSEELQNLNLILEFSFLSEQLVQFFLERPFLCVGQGIKLPEIMLDVLHTLIKAEDIG